MHVSVRFREGVEGKGGGGRACKKCGCIPERSKTLHSKGHQHQRWKSLADMCLHCLDLFRIFESEFFADLCHENQDARSDDEDNDSGGRTQVKAIKVKSRPRPCEMMFWRILRGIQHASTYRSKYTLRIIAFLYALTSVDFDGAVWCQWLVLCCLIR